MGPGFFLEHGHPEVGTYDLKPIVFWPDEWDNALHGIKAINNYVQVYIPDKQNEGIWRSGRVFEYCGDEDKYKVLLDTEEGSAVEVIPENIQTITNNNNNADDDGYMMIVTMIIMIMIIILKKFIRRKLRKNLLYHS